MDVICTAVDGSITSQPVVHAGNQNGVSQYISPVITTALTDAFERERIQTLATYQGAISMIMGVTTGAVLNTATTYRGRFMALGLLIEDQ